LVPGKEEEMRRYVSMLFATMLVFGSSFLSTVSADEMGVTEDTILIGAFGPITGPAAWIGLGARDGMKLAIKEINEAGGIHGRKVKVIFEDDAASPSRALSAVKKLLGKDEVFMIFSGAGSNSTVGVIDFVKSRKVPMYVCIASAPPVTHPHSKYLFRGGTTETARYGEIYSDFVTQALGAKKIAILSGRDEYPKNEAIATTKHLKDWFGIEPTLREEFNVGDKDFTPQLLAIKKAEPEVIMVFGHPPEGTIILRQARELGLPQPIFGGAALVDTTIPLNAKYAAEGFMGTYLLPLFLDSKDPDMLKFREAYSDEYPNAPRGRPNWCDVMAYGDMYCVAEGLKRAGKDLTREKFIEGLETLRDFRVNRTATPRTFTDKHHIGNLRLQPMVILNGRWLPLAWEPTHETDILKK
jgi:branched-chain amino acid transport system substrate-binding protein